MRTDGRTDGWAGKAGLTIAFRYLCESPWKLWPKWIKRCDYPRRAVECKDPKAPKCYVISTLLILLLFKFFFSLNLIAFRNVFSPTGFAGYYLFVLKNFFSDLVNETNFVHNFFSLYFVNIIYNLYMFWTSPGPSSGGTTVFFATLRTCVLHSCLECRIPSCIPDSYAEHKCQVYAGFYPAYQTSMQNTSAKCRKKYSCSSWWWTWRGPKKVVLINNIDEIHWEKIVHQVRSFYKIM